MPSTVVFKRIKEFVDLPVQGRVLNGFKDIKLNIFRMTRLDFIIVFMKSKLLVFFTLFSETKSGGLNKWRLVFIFGHLILKIIITIRK